MSAVNLLPPYHNIRCLEVAETTPRSSDQVKEEIFSLLQKRYYTRTPDEETSNLKQISNLFRVAYRGVKGSSSCCAEVETTLQMYEELLETSVLVYDSCLQCCQISLTLCPQATEHLKQGKKKEASALFTHIHKLAETIAENCNILLGQSFPLLKQGEGACRTINQESCLAFSKKQTLVTAQATEELALLDSSHSALGKIVAIFQNSHAFWWNLRMHSANSIELDSIKHAIKHPLEVDLEEEIRNVRVNWQALQEVSQTLFEATRKTSDQIKSITKPDTQTH